MNIVAVIPVKGRAELLSHTVERLYGQDIDVVLVGEKEDLLRYASGTHCVIHENEPLGKKWNAGFKYAELLQPDAVLFVGSSDWVSDNWCETLYPHLEAHEMVGVSGFYLLDIADAMRACFWPGYNGPRADEPIGIGRLISKRALDAMNWEPFDPTLNNNMDYTMYRKVIDNGGTVKIVPQDGIYALSISTNRWDNKHKFEDHWSGKLPSKILGDHSFIKEHFPEAYEIFQ